MIFKNKDKNNLDKYAYKPFGKSEEKVYKPYLYDDEKINPFEEIEYSQEEETSQSEDYSPKDYILEYLLKEYS